ncbi:g1351 [Coccomyxa viridis]|uniref:G1351 protein n=1 Tax=Coccomyxa viridis TaxID=1274662 RepID=A0ABP1FN31_9CHLO
MDASESAQSRPGRSKAPKGGLLAVAWGRYLKQLEKTPLETKALTSATLAGLSDIVAQRIVSRGALNWRRTAAIALYGLVWSGPSLHYWQQLQERIFKGKRDPVSLVKRVLLDQLTFGPFCNALFMSYIAMVVEGRSWDFTKAKLYTDFSGVQKNGWRLWPLASWITYQYIPLRLRVLFVNVVAFFWSTFLNYSSRTALTSWRK